MNWEERAPWTSSCRERGCTWIQEKSMREFGWWIYHKDGEGKPVSMEDRMFISGDGIVKNWGKVQQVVMAYYEAHHRSPMDMDFDEERERARLVAV